MAESEFKLAGAEIGWPIGSAPGLTNHPNIEIVANRLENLASSGVSFVPLGSWKLGEPDGGNGYIKTPQGLWDYQGGDEYVDVELGAGFNAKGLPGPGTRLGMESLDDLMDIAASKNVELALSLSPHTGNPLEELKELMEIGRKALLKEVLYVEVNLSCPNVPDRPPFYKDAAALAAFFNYLETIDPLINRYGHPGLYPKYGPFGKGEYPPKIHEGHRRSIGGRVTSNTLGGQEPLTPEGEQAIKVNGGKAGMSGPRMKELGREQLQLHMSTQQYGETISVLGIGDGAEVNSRLAMGAVAVQLGSVLYWPELVGCENATEVVRQIKEEFVEASVA